MDVCPNAQSKLDLSCCPLTRKKGGKVFFSSTNDSVWRCQPLASSFVEWRGLGRDQKKRLDREVLNRAAKEREAKREEQESGGEKVDWKVGSRSLFILVWDDEIMILMNLKFPLFVFLISFHIHTENFSALPSLTRVSRPSDRK